MKKKVLISIVLLFLSIIGMAQQVEVFIPTGHTSWLTNAVYSPDGKYIISCAIGGYIKIWDAMSGRAIQTLEVQARRIFFSPDGKQFISSGYGKGMKIWELPSAREVKSFEDINFTFMTASANVSGSGPRGSAIFTPDGKHILSQDAEDKFKIWNIDSGKVVREPRITGQDPVYSPDGTVLLTRHEKSVKLWDAITETELRSLEGHTETVLCAGFSADGTMIVSGSSDKTIRIWDTETGRVIRTITDPSASWYISFSSDGRKILSANGGIIKMWNALTGELLFSHGDPYGLTDGGWWSVQFSPDGRYYIAAHGMIFAITLFDAESGSHLGSYFQNSAQLTSLTLSRDGKSLATNGRDGRLRIWDIESGKQNQILSGEGRELFQSKGNTDFSPGSDASFLTSPDGSLSYSINDNKLSCKAANTKTEIWTWEYSTRYSYSSDIINMIDLSPDGKHIAVAAGDLLIILNAGTGKEIIRQKNREKIRFVAFIADGKNLFTSGGDREYSRYGIKIWEVETLREIHRIPGGGAVLSPNGELVASEGYHTIFIYCVKTGERLHTLTGHTGDIAGKAFSPDGKHLITCSSDSTARVWDVDTGKEVARFIGFTDGEWIVMTPDGYYNASIKGDQYLNIRVDYDVFGVDQYRHIFFRPDIVKTALSGDVAAYQSAVKEAGANINSAVPPPQISILTLNDRQTIKTAQAELTVSIDDENHTIKNVWITVNGRLVAGRSATRDLSMPSSGLTVTGIDKEMFFTIPLDIEDGLNTVEVFAFNGYAEAKATVSFAAEINQKPPNLWIIAIGVNKYTSPLIRDLSYAVNDAVKIADVFTKQEGKRYGKVNTLVIADGEKQKPTAAAIRESFSWFRQAGNRDLCILFIAGHAVNDPAGLYYFLPADAAFDSTGNLNPETAISQTEINAVLDMPGRKLFIIDTCHSAGAGKTGIADTNSFIRQVMEYYPVIFSSSRGSELSQESPTFQHGLFTYSIIKGMEGEATSRISGTVSMKSLDSYVSEIVSELSGGRQNPITITPNGYDNFILAVP